VTGDDNGDDDNNGDGGDDNGDDDNNGDGGDDNGNEAYRLS
jgi:hypothetical protein